MDSNLHRRACFLLWLSLVCCVVEGAVRKWAVGDASIAGRLAYLSKDIAMAAFLLISGYSVNPLTQIAKPSLQIGLGLLGVGTLVSSLWGIDPIGGPLTILTFFVLPFAAWRAGSCLPPDAMWRFARWVSLLAVLVCPLGVLQFYSPSGSPINRYSLEGEEHIALSAVSERVRATGTFAYITGFGEFAELAVWAGIVTFSVAQTPRDRWLGYLGLCAGLCCALVTVSRAVVIICIVQLAAWAIYGGQMGQKLKTAAAIVIVSLTVLVVTGRLDEASEITSTVYLRHEAAKNETLAGRLWYHFILPLNAIEWAPMGNGLGGEQAARNIIATNVGPASTFESPWGRTIMELGIIGCLGFLFTLGSAFVPWKAAYKMLPVGGEKAAFAVTGAALATRALLGFQFNHVAAYFFWAMTACVLASGSLVSMRGNIPINVVSAAAKGPGKMLQ